MRLEKRGAPADPVEQTPPVGKKPVVVYIMVLFIAAFLLMAWSFASHQRSNTEALGQLQNSVSAMQEVQDLQNQVIELQKQLADSREAADDLKDAFEEANDAGNLASHNLEQTQEAMDLFWQLNEAWLQEDTERCRALLAELRRNQEDPLDGYLTQQAAGRYAEILAALEEP